MRRSSQIARQAVHPSALESTSTGERDVTLGIIDTHVTNALKATTADEKLDEIARAVGELP